jgi:exosortase K
MSPRRAVTLATIVLAMWGLKRHYADAEVEDVRWILWPTAQLVAAATGSPFELEPGAGYLSRERLFLIEKSCAGVNFMIAALGLTGLVLARESGDGRRDGWILGQGLALAYAAAVVVNSIRILVAIPLASADLGRGWWTAARIHRLEGITVYFAGLLLLDRVVRRLAAAPRSGGAAS